MGWLKGCSYPPNCPFLSLRTPLFPIKSPTSQKSPGELVTSTSVVILSHIRLQAGLTFSPISPEPTKDQERLKACSESLQSELPISSLKSPHLRKSPSHKAPPPWGSLAFSGLSTQAVAGDNLNDWPVPAAKEVISALAQSYYQLQIPISVGLFPVPTTYVSTFNQESRNFFSYFRQRDLKPRNDFEGVEGHVLEHEGAAAEMQLGDEEAAAAPGWGLGQHSPQTAQGAAAEWNPTPLCAVQVTPCNQTPPQIPACCQLLHPTINDASSSIRAAPSHLGLPEASWRGVLGSVVT